MRWKIEKSSGSLILGGSNDIRVEKGPCKLDSWDSSVRRVEKGLSEE